jgi:hypothetical protein
MRQTRHESSFGILTQTPMRMWQTIRTSALGRQVHKHAYAALVLSGCYEEAGDSVTIE